MCTVFTPKCIAYLKPKEGLQWKHFIIIWRMFITNALFQWFYLFSQWDMNFRYSLKWMATVGTKVSIIIYHKTGFSLMAFNLQNLSTLPTDFLMNTFKSHLIMTKHYKAFCRTWCFPCRMFEVIQNTLKWVSNHLTMDTNCITVCRRTCAPNGYKKLMAKCENATTLCSKSSY